MGPEATVHANRIVALPAAEPPEAVAKLRAAYSEDVDIFRLASDLVLDVMADRAELRDQLIWRLVVAAGKLRWSPERHHEVFPV
jgi:acetyl-CoA carboxylase carboxyltransferase component